VDCVEEVSIFVVVAASEKEGELLLSLLVGGVGVWHCCRCFCFLIRSWRGLGRLWEGGEGEKHRFGVCGRACGGGGGGG